MQASELKAEEYYFDIVRHYAESQATQPEVGAKSEKYVQELEPLVQSYQSHRLLRFFYQIKVASYMCRNDYRTTIGVCNEALSALQAKTFYPQSHNAFFYFQKIVCLAQLKEFEEGKRLAEGEVGFLVDFACFNFTFDDRITKRPSGYLNKRALTRHSDGLIQ